MGRSADLADAGGVGGRQRGHFVGRHAPQLLLHILHERAAGIHQLCDRLRERHEVREAPVADASAEVEVRATGGRTSTSAVLRQHEDVLAGAHEVLRAVLLQHGLPDAVRRVDDDLLRKVHVGVHGGRVLAEELPHRRLLALRELRDVVNLYVINHSAAFTYACACVCVAPIPVLAHALVTITYTYNKKKKNTRTSFLMGAASSGVSFRRG